MRVTDLWLDDERKPPTFSDCGIFWTWIKTVDEAIEILKTKTVEFCSLDHDLAYEHYHEFILSQQENREFDRTKFKEKTGYDILLWMESNNIWPNAGIRIHTMNTVGKLTMLSVVQNHYGRLFQWQYKGTHTI